MIAKDEILTQFRDLPAGTTDKSDDALARLFPWQPDVSVLTVTCRPENYSASVIARAVEDCDAHLLNLNVTAERADNGELVIEIRINRANPDTVARSLVRFGYEPVGTELSLSSEKEETARNRIDELIRYLEL